jgi:hypothetical protein
MKIYWKKNFPFNSLYLILMSSFMKCFFSAKFKILVLETPVIRSLPFFQGFSFIKPLNYTPKFRSLSQKLWPQAIVQERVKKYLVIKLESEFYTTKTLKFKFFWKYLPSTMFWQCILGPQQIFNILPLFLFTLKADCNKKWLFLP